jgi:hypothetical protein
MGKTKRAGLKSASSIHSGVSLNRGVSTRSGISTRSGLSGKSGHTTSGGKSVRSTGSGDWSDDEGPPTSATALRPGVGMAKTKSGLADKSMRTLLKSANSVSSGLSIGGSTHHSKGVSYKQRKARPGLAVAPQGASTTSGMTRQNSGLNRGLSSRSGMSSGSGHRIGKTSPANSNHDGTMKKQMSMRSLGSEKSKHSLARSRSGRSLASGKSAASGGNASSKSKRAPAPPAEEEYDDEDYYASDGEEYEEDLEDDDMPEEERTIVMPQTEEEIRKGLHTEQVTKGIFRKKVRSIKWYSADIDKVDAGKYEPGETIEEGGSEYESDSDDSQEVVPPDPWYIALGRGLLLLEKKGEETTPIKIWLRLLTWLTFICDATAAIVVLIQFDTVQQCCDRDIMNLGSINLDWQDIIRYAVIFYLILILLEVYPVLRRGFPFNIINPMIGFTISLALFFDDGYTEALIMWCIETIAVLCEFAAYRVKIRQINMRTVEIKTIMPKTTKKKESFEDEDEYLKDLHKARRRYYVLKQEQRMDKRLLQYLHVAVYMNIIMSSIILMLILVIARNGGLCIVDFDYPNPFASNQFERCNLCPDPEQLCEVCHAATETYQCYIPYS